MKLLATVLVFAVCVGIGFRKAAGIEGRADDIQTAIRETESILLHVQIRKLPIQSFAKEEKEMRMLHILEGTAEAAEQFRYLLPKEQAYITRFIHTMQNKGTSEIAAEGRALIECFSKAAKHTEEEKTRTGMFRAVGALCGAVLAILLW